jgi:3-phosphoshikimate 1-carboxyvinyltransferase
MPFKISSPGKVISGSVELPISKSEASRIAFINALIGNELVVAQSAADDTQQLVLLLNSSEEMLDAADGASTARFVLAYCVVKQRKAIINGSEGLKRRPMNDAVDSLRQLGARISYLEEEGYLPVSVEPASLTLPDILRVSGKNSSQHVSALMMIAPLLHESLTIEISDEASSFPYIQLTAAIMRQFGVSVSCNTSEIVVKGRYQNGHVNAHADWSAASYFYAIAALCNEAHIQLGNLDLNSMQADRRIMEFMEPFGVRTVAQSGSVLIEKSGPCQPDFFSASLKDCPDIALSMAAVCGGLSCTADLLDLQTLRFKESDRAAAFQREGYKLNIKTDFCGGSKLKILSGSEIKPTARMINTYNDHRVAMSFATLSVVTNHIFLNHIDCVSKSFPGFFKELQKLGFMVNPTS